MNLYGGISETVFQWIEVARVEAAEARLAEAQSEVGRLRQIIDSNNARLAELQAEVDSNAPTNVALTEALAREAVQSAALLLALARAAVAFASGGDMETFRSQTLLGRTVDAALADPTLATVLRESTE